MEGRHMCACFCQESEIRSNEHRTWCGNYINQTQKIASCIRVLTRASIDDYQIMKCSLVTQTFHMVGVDVCEFPIHSVNITLNFIPNFFVFYGKRFGLWCVLDCDDKDL